MFSIRKLLYNIKLQNTIDYDFALNRHVQNHVFLVDSETIWMSKRTERIKSCPLRERFLVVKLWKQYISMDSVLQFVGVHVASIVEKH